MSKEAKTVWYHGTSQENWEIILDEGVLWGKRDAPSNVTYLAADRVEAEQYGPVVLEVQYNPTGGINNYAEGCWQMRVYDPIPLDNVRLL